MSRLKKIREARGLRREDVAVRAEISYEYVRKLEQEDHPSPTLDVARRIADALEVSVDELFPSEAA